MAASVPIMEQRWEEPELVEITAPEGRADRCDTVFNGNGTQDPN